MRKAIILSMAWIGLAWGQEVAPEEPWCGGDACVCPAICVPVGPAVCDPDGVCVDWCMPVCCCDEWGWEWWPPCGCECRGPIAVPEIAGSVGAARRFSGSLIGMAGQTALMP